MQQVGAAISAGAGTAVSRLMRRIRSASGWRLAAGAAVVLLLSVSGWMAWRRWIDRTGLLRLYRVEQGVIRSAQLQGDDLECALRRYGIRTIVRLNGTGPTDPRTLEEDEVARSHGVRVFVFCLPPQGVAEFADLDRVADLIADVSLRPMLVHCEAGLDRTSAVIAAWRLRRCGWSWERTLEEIRRFGPQVRAASAFRRHLEAYGAACASRARATAEPPPTGGGGPEDRARGCAGVAAPGGAR